MTSDPFARNTFSQATPFLTWLRTLQRRVNITYRARNGTFQNVESNNDAVVSAGARDEERAARYNVSHDQKQFELR